MLVQNKWAYCPTLAIDTLFWTRLTWWLLKNAHLSRCSGIAFCIPTFLNSL